MGKLKHNMLLDAKQVEDLGLFDYLIRAFRAKTEEDVEKICDELEAALASCDVRKDYVSVERLAMTVRGGSV
jgi:hypothetical protein